MTREEAIKQLELLKLFDCPLLLEAKRMAASALREQEERRWISVEERLPEVGNTVLVYSEFDGVCIDYNGGDSFGYALVTHWMPLPEPPKEDAK